MNSGLVRLDIWPRICP